MTQGGELPDFSDAALSSLLDGGGVLLDSLDFGVIAMDRGGLVTAYNAFESQRAGIPAVRVLGRNFFLEVGPCTNNYLVAQRYWDTLEAEAVLDEQLDYVFTLRMRPTPVRLRLLARPGSAAQYLAVRPR